MMGVGSRPYSSVLEYSSGVKNTKGAIYKNVKKISDFKTVCDDADSLKHAPITKLFGRMVE